LAEVEIVSDCSAKSGEYYYAMWEIPDGIAEWPEWRNVFTVVVHLTKPKARETIFSQCN
jgi:hypothetical protein